MQNRNKLDLGEDPNHVGIESRHRRGRAPESYNELEMSQATAMQHYQGYLDTSLHLEFSEYLHTIVTLANHLG